jgi:hypothetical protein
MRDEVGEGVSQAANRRHHAGGQAAFPRRATPRQLAVARSAILFRVC